MITYNRSAFGLNLIFQVHGSAVYRAVVPSLVSVAIYFLFRLDYIPHHNAADNENFGADVGHPYAIGALVASASFLFVFRANQGYARYWEGCTDVHQMMSKWMDATVHAAVYHLQCDHFQDVKPPSYFEYAELNHLYLTRDRERGVEFIDGNKDQDEWLGNRPQKQKHAYAATIHGSTHASRQREWLKQQLTVNRKSVNQRNHVIHTEKINRQHQAVHKRINHMSPPSQQQLQLQRRRKKPVLYQSDSSVSCDIPYGRNHNSSSSNSNHNHNHNHNSSNSDNDEILNPSRFLRTHSAGDIDELLFANDDGDGDDGDGEDNNNINNNDTPARTRTSEQFFEQLQQQVAQATTKTTIPQPETGKPFPLCGRPRLDGGWETFYNTTSNTGPSKYYNNSNNRSSQTPLGTFSDPQQPNGPLPKEGFASLQGGRTPPLYLQELAHLSSLLVAVALSTLRNDIDGAESPLTYYEPGSEWPMVDPDLDDWIKVSRRSEFWQYWPRQIWTFLGMGRSPEEQTQYNSGRPLPVIGGVSDAEIRFLQMARGPYAKTQLCWNWISEFMIREHLAGSMGNPPIDTHFMQFLGDGMIFYNNARKIMFIPFPFVHAQLTVLFVLVLIPTIAYLMDQWTEEAWSGTWLTFFTVLCLTGVHETACDLENPFRNVPNELPLVTFMAQYNEAVLTIYSGYHPDFFWNGQELLRRRAHLSGQTVATTATTTTSDTHDDEEEEDHNNHTISRATTTLNEKDYEDEDDDDGSEIGMRKEHEDTGKPPHHDPDEIAQLKEQVAKQAKLIQQLFAQLGPLSSSSNDPIQATQRLQEETLNC